MKKISEASIEREKEMTSFLSVNEGKSNIHYEQGRTGNIIVIESPACDVLAKMLEVPDGWKLVPIVVGPNFSQHASNYVAYAKGDRLSFFEDESDYEGGDIHPIKKSSGEKSPE